jgi:acetone carboxylase gamma subunit
MKVQMTENLRIDLEAEMWECRKCDTPLVSARENYKRGLLVYDRDPREIHAPIIDPEKYDYTFSPDPEWIRILEYCCPNCGTQMEVEYLPPGHPPVHDMQIDIDALKAQWAEREELAEPVLGPKSRVV